MKHVFLAISFHNNRYLSDIIKNVKSELGAENIAWVEEKNLHLTLKFFGPIDDLTVASVKEALANSLVHKPSFPVSFHFLSIFGSRYQPRVVWMGMENTEPIASIENSIRKAMVGIGIGYDRQNFVPHLTFGRIKKLESKKHFQSVIDKYKKFNSGEIKVNSLFLYQSIMTSDGPIYKVLKEFKLK